MAAPVCGPHPPEPSPPPTPREPTPRTTHPARRAQLSNQVQPWAEELALVELGHVKVAHQMLSNASVSCPSLDVEGGFAAFMDAAANQTSSPPFDPFANDVNFLLSVLVLEDVGSQGEKVGVQGCVGVCGGVQGCVGVCWGGRSAV